jgi:hypothetical protein
MIEFVECPLLKKRITPVRCEVCPGSHFGGVRVTLSVEKITESGGAGETFTTQINEKDLPAFMAAHPVLLYQTTTGDRFVQCRFPRRLPLEGVDA